MLRHNVVITAGSCGIAALAVGLAPATAQAAQATRAAPEAQATGAAWVTRAAAAGQAPAPGWRIVHVNNYGGHDSLTAVTAVSDLAASSASNVWAFISGHPAAAARFDGTAWRVVREWPGEAFSITGEAFSARDVWMFGGIGPRTAGTWHYDGRSWTRPKMPLTAFDVSRVSAKDEWAIEN